MLSSFQDNLIWAFQDITWRMQKFGAEKLIYLSWWSFEQINGGLLLDIFLIFTIIILNDEIRQRYSLFYICRIYFTYTICKCLVIICSYRGILFPLLKTNSWWKFSFYHYHMNMCLIFTNIHVEHISIAYD